MMSKPTLRERAILAQYHSIDKQKQVDSLRELIKTYPTDLDPTDIVSNTKPPFHVVEPSLWFIAKRAWSKFKNYLLNKINN